MVVENDSTTYRSTGFGCYIHVFVVVGGEAEALLGFGRLARAEVGAGSWWEN